MGPRIYTGGSDNLLVLAASWFCSWDHWKPGYTHGWSTFFFFLALLGFWSGNQYTPVVTPGYSQGFHQLKDVLGEIRIHTHTLLDFQ